MKILIVLLLGIGAVALWCLLSTRNGSPIEVFAKVVASASYAKLGWMDDAELSDADRSRIAKITGRGVDSNLSAIRIMQSGYSSGIGRRDFELLRQDRRRAKAAYPDVSDDDLYTATWLTVSLSDRVPSDFCTSGNSDGTQGADGKWYLDGGCYIGIVNPKYTKRADAATTKRVLAELKDENRQKEIRRIQKWGYSTWWSGTDGNGTVSCYPDPLPSDQVEGDLIVPGKCFVILNDTKYVFAFVASDWVTPPYYDDLRKLALSRDAEVSKYIPAPSKPWVMKDGMLATGEKCPEGRLCWSKWNGDGYDNHDIGPSNPASWVLGSFGLGYNPAPDNGEKLSENDRPWYVVASYWGYQTQTSGGWTEKEAKDALPKLVTEQVFGMQGQSPEQVNRGNLREARATQIKPENVLMLVDKSLPSAPAKAPDLNMVPYYPGMTLMPGQSTSVGGR